MRNNDVESSKRDKGERQAGALTRAQSGAKGRGEPADLVEFMPEPGGDEKRIMVASRRREG